MPETFFEWMRFLSGPLIGALIGYLTNWLAVKMLFRPRKALYIGKLHVPFTPGVIPRRQGALAGALGRMVSEMLVRKEDLKDSLCSEAVSRTVAKTVLSLPSVHHVGEQVLGEEKYDAIISNPPYIRSDVIDTLSREVRHEPRAALDGGDDGLIFYRAIVEGYAKNLSDGGRFIFEIGYDQAEDLKKIALEGGFDCSIVKDLGGCDRVAILKRTQS